MTRTETKRDRLRQAPALIVSLVALFTALSGAAMALPGTETVNSGDIKNESVKSVDLKDDQAVASSDVIDETLQSTDVAADTLQANDLAPGSVTSSELAPASVGAQEIADGITPRFGNNNVPGGTAHNGAYNFAQATASCQAGEELVGASAQWTGDAADDETMIAEIIPNHAAETVTVRGGNDSGDNAVLWAEADCL